MLRSSTDRLLQSLAFEAGGLLLAVPFYHAMSGRPADESLILMLALSLAVLLWNPVHNRLFDRAEHRLTGRSGRDRPHGVRVLHAISHEVTPIVVTLPLVMVIGRHGLAEALTVNVGLTIVYMAYAYAFYLAYDQLFPHTHPLPWDADEQSRLGP